MKSSNKIWTNAANVHSKAQEKLKNELSTLKYYVLSLRKEKEQATLQIKEIMEFKLHAQRQLMLANAEKENRALREEYEALKKNVY